MHLRLTLLLVLIMYGSLAHGQAAKLPTTPTAAHAAGPRLDTAVVSSYYRVPVFYRCRPLHRYTTVGTMTRMALASYSSRALEQYARAARRKYGATSIGIMIDDMNFGADSFRVVRFSAADGRADTAILSSQIFFSAKPTKPYKVIRVLNDELDYGSLNTTLQRYLTDAGSLHVPYDGIMVRDVSYTFGRDAIFVFRWQGTPGPSRHGGTTLR